MIFINNNFHLKKNIYKSKEINDSLLTKFIFEEFLADFIRVYVYFRKSTCFQKGKVFLWGLSTL